MGDVPQRAGHPAEQCQVHANVRHGHQAGIPVLSAVQAHNRVQALVRNSAEPAADAEEVRYILHFLTVPFLFLDRCILDPYNVTLNNLDREFDE